MSDSEKELTPTEDGNKSGQHKGRSQHLKLSGQHKGRSQHLKLSDWLYWGRAKLSY
jgi:hypothetical protein